MPTPFQDVSVGTVANDGTGDPIRTAFGKVNANLQLIEDIVYLDDVNGRIGIGVTPSHVVDIVTDQTKPQDEHGIKIVNTKDVRTGSEAARCIRVTGNWEGTATTGTFPMEGIRANINYGGAGTPPVAANGNIHGIGIDALIRGSGQESNEHATLFGVLRYEIGTGFDQSTAPAGRGWFADFNVHGPIAVRPDLLTGITQFVNNHFNGSPTAEPSVAFAAVTFPGRGGGKGLTHTNATTFPVDVGFAVHGKSGTIASPTGIGFKTGFQAGGTGSGWSAPSILERAFYGRDVTIEGLRLDNPGAGSPKGIVISGATWGTLIDMSGVTSPPTVGILMPNSDMRWNTDGGGNIGAGGSVGRPNNVFVMSTVNVGGGTILGVQGGGRLELLNSAAVHTNPGANRLRLYVRDGTTANTLKLVVIAGATGTQTTVLDNIPTA